MKKTIFIIGVLSLIIVLGSFSTKSSSSIIGKSALKSISQQTFSLNNELAAWTWQLVPCTCDDGTPSTKCTYINTAYPSCDPTGGTTCLCEEDPVRP